MVDHSEDDARVETPSTKTPNRKAYRSPKLTKYGDLPRLVAMGKPGTRSDGPSVPKTKT